MSWYEFLLFVHISASIVWIGAGFLLLILGLRADRTDDEAGIERILEDNAWLATRLFIPASLTVVVAGVLLTVDGPWEFSQLWVVLGLIGYAATFVVLVLVVADMAIKPTGDDVGLLAAMALIFAAGLAWAISAAQSVRTPGEAPA
jgi:uncharacterized membrane protein